jgi:hypothetical protein
MAASRAELAAQVAAQNSLVYVTACQIKVAAAQFRIDLEKMELGFHERTPSTMGRYLPLPFIVGGRGDLLRSFSRS